MDDLLTSIRRIMAEDEGAARPASADAASRVPASGVHAKRNEEVPLDLSPSEADRLPELVERSIMNAFAGLGEDEDEDAAAPRPARERSRGRAQDHSAAMVSIADALAREFASSGRGGAREEQPGPRADRAFAPHVLSEPGLEDETVEDFDEAAREEARQAPERHHQPREGDAREPERAARTAGERVASLRGRLEPRFGEPREAADPHASTPADHPGGEARRATPAPSAAQAPSAEEPRATRPLRAVSEPSARAGSEAPARSAPVSGPIAPGPTAPGQIDVEQAPASSPSASSPSASVPTASAPPVVEGNVFRRPAAEKRVERSEEGRRAEATEPPRRAERAERPQRVEHAERPERAERVERTDDALTSVATRESIELALEQLSRTVITQSPRTLEDLVRDMMRPLLREWLEANLAKIVERTVRQEIERVARRY